MARVTNNDETFVENDEVVYPNSDVIDAEPHYNNFTAIQKAIGYDYEQKQSNAVSYIFSKFRNFRFLEKYII